MKLSGRLTGELDRRARGSKLLEPVVQQPGAGQIENLNACVIHYHAPLTVGLDVCQRRLDLCNVFDTPSTAQVQCQRIARAFGLK
jgi:hypothetical protein